MYAVYYQYTNMPIWGFIELSLWNNRPRVEISPQSDIILIPNQFIFVQYRYQLYGVFFLSDRSGARHYGRRGRMVDGSTPTCAINAWNKTNRHDINIVESGIKHHKTQIPIVVIYWIWRLCFWMPCNKQLNSVILV